MSSASHELKESRQRLLSVFSGGDVSDMYTDLYTEVMDQYFRGSLQDSNAGQHLFRLKIPFAFVAVGGYGRKELCLHSDIDILILFRKKVPDAASRLAEETFYPLWDLGLDLGYGVRSIKDCVGLAAEDFEVMTSLMDARFICGDSPLYLSMVEALGGTVVRKRATAFGTWLKDLYAVRTEQFGDASYMLEPNLKDGAGGLRDYHSMLWLAKAFLSVRNPRDLEYFGTLSHREYEELRQHVRFILTVRNHLHLLAGRRADRLYFQYQEQIAAKMGYRNRPGESAVERFLGDLHASMASLKALHRSFIATHIPKKGHVRKLRQAPPSTKGLTGSQGEIGFVSATHITNNPMLLMDVFMESTVTGEPLSLEARRLVREFLHLADDSFRGSAPAWEKFLSILMHKNASAGLEQMFETEFLETFIPEFTRIKDQVQFDAYHTYPAGRHSLETVHRLKLLAHEHNVLLLDLFSELSEQEPLLLAALFHDIGKGGKGHAEKGVRIARGILQRAAYPKPGTDDILFLIRHHLLLAETATRRDLNDEKIVVQCARTIRDVERLKMLYLLTWADSNATGPRAWNAWIANLVEELFFKVLHLLERGHLATPAASRRVQATTSRVRKLMSGTVDAARLERCFDRMPPRFMLNASPADIVRYTGAYLRFKDEYALRPGVPFFLDARMEEAEDCWEVTFVGRDRPGLFSDIAGVMTLNGINILASHVYNWRDGTALDIFRVTNPLDSMNPHETWEKVRSDLTQTFTGKLALPVRVARKTERSIIAPGPVPSAPPRVLIDNDSSDFFTVIEVFADDRPGILYLLTRTLYDLKLDIRVARVATKGDQIADVFYVIDLEGQKVVDTRQVSRITGALLHRLEGMEGEA